MAHEQRVADISLDAGEDLSSYQYYVVGLNSSSQAVLADGDETICMGILQNKPAAAGREAQVRNLGISKAVYGGTVTVGAHLKSSSGKLIVTTTAGDRYVAIAKTAGVVNDVGTVFCENGYYPKT